MDILPAQRRLQAILPDNAAAENREIIARHLDDVNAERFGFLLDAFKYGPPPHGGIAPGLDRVVALMAGCDSLRDVIPFPKVQNSGDLMTDAPNVVDAAQLDDLGIMIAPGSDK